MVANQSFYFNSLAPGKFAWNFRQVIFNQILVIDGWGISCEIALIAMSLDFTDDQSILIQVMAGCRQATSHYLRQCWPRSLLPYGVTKPQWVKDNRGGITQSIHGIHRYKARGYIRFINSYLYLCGNCWNDSYRATSCIHIGRGHSSADNIIIKRFELSWSCTYKLHNFGSL